MNKFAIIFSLALFLTPLSALPQGGGYQALEAEELSNVIDLENQAPRGRESARADDLVAVIVVDEEWLKKNGIEFNRAIHLNIDDECPLEHGTFRELFDAEAGALYVAQVMTDEQVRYFWYSGERLKAWLQKSMTDPQSRLPVKLVKYFSLDSIEAGKELRLVSSCDPKILQEIRQEIRQAQERLGRLERLENSTASGKRVFCVVLVAIGAAIGMRIYLESTIIHRCLHQQCYPVDGFLGVLLVPSGVAIYAWLGATLMFGW